MSTRIFGSGIRRREDPRLITGSATYTDDLTLPGMLHAALLRSPHAHARIKKIDVGRARKAPGVVAAFHGREIDGLAPVPCAWLLPNADLKVAKYPPVATDVVRYVGDIVAVVVAETVYQAYDALELIDVDYEPLPVRHRRSEPRSSLAHLNCTPMCRTIRRSTGPWPAVISRRHSRMPTSSSKNTSSSSD